MGHAAHTLNAQTPTRHHGHAHATQTRTHTLDGIQRIRRRKQPLSTYFFFVQRVEGTVVRQPLVVKGDCAGLAGGASHTAHSGVSEITYIYSSHFSWNIGMDRFRGDDVGSRVGVRAERPREAAGDLPTADGPAPVVERGALCRGHAS